MTDCWVAPWRSEELKREDYACLLTWNRQKNDAQPFQHLETTFKITEYQFGTGFWKQYRYHPYPLFTPPNPPCIYKKINLLLKKKKIEKMIVREGASWINPWKLSIFNTGYIVPGLGLLPLRFSNSLRKSSPLTAFFLWMIRSTRNLKNPFISQWHSLFLWWWKWRILTLYPWLFIAFLYIV